MLRHVYCSQDKTLEIQNAAAAAEEDAEAWQDILSGKWPFQGLCDQLCMDVLNPEWESRHGAAVALREVLRSHAASAAVEVALSNSTSGVLCHLLAE
jgi:hypothetical protein